MEENNINKKTDHSAVNSMNVLALAYMGDAVYESAVREYILVSCPSLKVNGLHKQAVRYVKASSQAKAMLHMLHSDFLTAQETAVVKRARNHSANTPKNADVSDYRYATGLEALIGYVHLVGDKERSYNIINKAIEVINQDQ